jgi:hypothetical protein
MKTLLAIQGAAALESGFMDSDCVVDSTKLLIFCSTPSSRIQI